MGHSMMQSMPWGGTRSRDSAQMSTPIALLGMAGALVLGVVMGVLTGKKSSMMSSMSGRGGRKHHHHGWGEPACKQRHEMGEAGGEKGPRAEQAAPGAEPGERRNEGE